MPAIIQSLLETDLYKLTMQQAMLHHMPANIARYELVCRSRPQLPLATLAGALNEQLDALCALRFRKEELAYLSTLRFFKPDYIEFLRLFQLNREFVHVHTDGDTLQVVAEGPQVHVMAFEIFVLSTVLELYTSRAAPPGALVDAQQRLDRKIDSTLQQLDALAREGRMPRYPFEVFDFGLRRRFSRAWHEQVVRTLQRRMPAHFNGTSNVDLARRLGLKPIGTMAHEYLQTFQAMPGVQLRQSQKAALETWVQEYRGDLGIALTDVITTDAFLADFDRYFAKLFDGLRHDSGDPVVWADKVAAHYRALGLADTDGRRRVFSDGLTMDGTALDIYRRVNARQQVRTGFGIGTSLTNDTVLPALNCVMKLVDCNGQPVAKISDEPGKTLCRDETFLRYLRQVFGVPEPAST